MVLKYYALVNNYIVDVEPFKPYTPKVAKSTPDLVVNDVKPITLAEFNPVTSSLITAHKLKDYRRRNFTLTLLPDVHLPIDDLLSEVTNIDDLL